MKREKSKRILLEELIVKLGEENRSNSSSASTIKSSTSFRCLSAAPVADDDDDESASTLSSVDSNDLLAELVRLRLAKTKKRKKKAPDNNWLVIRISKQPQFRLSSFI